MKSPDSQDGGASLVYHGYVCAALLTLIGSHLFTMIDLEDNLPVTNGGIAFFATCVLVGAHKYAITVLEYQIGARK